MLGLIDSNTFTLLGESTDRVFLPDLNELIRIYKQGDFVKTSLEQFLAHERLDNAGIMSAGVLAREEGYHGSMRFINDLGKAFVKHVLL